MKMPTRSRTFLGGLKRRHLRLVSSRGGSLLQWAETEVAPPKGEMHLSGQTVVELRKREVRVRQGAKQLVLREIHSEMQSGELAAWHSAIGEAVDELRAS